MAAAAHGRRAGWRSTRKVCTQDRLDGSIGSGIGGGDGTTDPFHGWCVLTTHTGLRTDRLVQACLVPSSISSAPGSNSNPLEVRLTKSRFSTQREHFIGRTAAVPVPCGDWGLEGNAAVSVVALEEALDDATGRSVH